MVHHRASARRNSFIKGAWDNASCHTIRIAISLIISPAHFMEPFDSSEGGERGGRGGEGGRAALWSDGRKVTACKTECWGEDTCGC